MKDYRGHWTRGGRSSVYTFDILFGTITIYFYDKRGKKTTYVYRKSIIGREFYSEMKLLAREGLGLNSYIIRNKIPGLLGAETTNPKEEGEEDEKKGWNFWTGFN